MPDAYDRPDDTGAETEKNDKSVQPPKPGADVKELFAKGHKTAQQKEKHQKNQRDGRNNDGNRW